MSIYSIHQKQFVVIAVLGILLFAFAGCAASSNVAESDSTDGEPNMAMDSSGNDSDTKDNDSDAMEVSSDDKSTEEGDAPGNSPGNVNKDTEQADDSDSNATVGTGEDGAGEDGAGEDGAGEDGAGEDGAGEDDVGKDADALLFEGIPVGYTEDGYVYRGDPNAPITIYEYSDYQCPYCQRHYNQTEPALNEQYVASGQVRFVFVDFPLTQIHPSAPIAHTAALCAAEQSPVSFWEMHHLIFDTQRSWGSAAEPVAEMASLAEQLDLDMDAFNDCVAGGRKDQIIAESVADAQQNGFGGTPSFLFVMEETGESYPLVGAQPFDKFSDWIDTMVAGEIPSDAAADSGEGGGDGEIPYWATAEGLAPDPDHAGYTMAGDPYRGNEDAKVVVIEFSDFQCPFCGRHTSQTQPILDENFVDTGDVRWVFKHFPLNIHAQAPAAGVAAECAGEQGKFWEMHIELFAGMASWSIREPNPVFVDIAASLALDMDAFESCLVDEEMMARIDTDFEAGRPFVQGTPTFIVMAGAEGRIIPGALPTDQFTEALQTVLDSAQ